MRNSGDGAFPARFWRFFEPPLAIPLKSLVPQAGLEPARSCLQQILSLPRLPFRHWGTGRCERESGS